MKIIIDDLAMSDPAEDWSDVRSPARAKRRRARGFPQRIRHYRIPKKIAFKIGADTLVMHSTLADVVKHFADPPRSFPELDLTNKLADQIELETFWGSVGCAS